MVLSGGLARSRWRRAYCWLGSGLVVGGSTYKHNGSLLKKGLQGSRVRRKSHPENISSALIIFLPVFFCIAEMKNGQDQDQGRLCFRAKSSNAQGKTASSGGKNRVFVWNRAEIRYYSHICVYECSDYCSEANSISSLRP
jgi:hypothetical protein